MKKAFTAILILFCVKYSHSQFQIIYQPPANRTIQTIASFRNNQNSNISFYLHLSGNTITALPPYWIRYYRNANLWDNAPHNNMLSGSTCFNGSGGFSFSQNTVFKRSQRDTNFILTRIDWVSCNPPENGYRNRISYNQGSNFNDISTAGFYSFDFDKYNDSLIYGAGSMYLQTTKFWRSTDRGASWTNIDLAGTYNEQTALIINPLRPSEILFSRSQNLYKSTNSGLNYITWNTFAANIKQIAVQNNDTSIFVVTNAGVYKWANGGNNFSQVSAVNFNMIIFHPEFPWIIYGASTGGLYRSTNGGTNWSLYFDNFSGSANVTGLAKYPNDLDTVYACNNSGLYKIWGSLIGIQSSGESQPEKFNLSQNYPNPFNPVTKIKFSLPNPSEGGAINVKLIIYDILGHEVATLVNEALKPGSYESEWDGSNFASGIYFYSLQTEDPSTGSGQRFTQTKKMVLMK